MTDRELLELAAKAAGLTVEWREWVTSRVAAFGTIKHTKQSGFWLDGKQWNPLTDDGDALRLAVKLGLFMRQAVKEIPRSEYEKDPYAATRRAIVRAAAAIGAST